MASDLGGSANNKELQLCFNRAHFQRSDFNMDRFVNLARKRATLEQLHTDLRAYLRHLQNCMIELINDDYADFVHLSSGLAALRESVDRVAADVKGNWSQFGCSVGDLEKCATGVDQCMAKLAGARQKQRAARDQLALLQSIQRLHSFLAKRPKQEAAANLQTWYSHLILLVSAVELWSGRVPANAEIVQQVERAKARCYGEVRELLVEAICEELRSIGKNNIVGKATNKNSNILALLLAPLQLLNQQDNAIWRVVSGVIAPKIGEQQIGGMEKQRKEAQLERALDEVKKLRASWAAHCKQGNQFTAEIATFLDTCLLNFVISFLDEHFSTVLVPSDARLFHRCFQLVTDRLIRRWPSRKCAPQAALLRTIRDKFSLVVYFKLASKPLLHPLKDHSAPEAFTYKVPSPDDSFRCLCPYSNSLLSALDALYSPELFLPNLTNKFWEFTLHRMHDYAAWARTMLDYFTSTHSAQQGGKEQKTSAAALPTVPSASNIAGRKSASPVPHQREPSPIALLPPTPIWLSLSALCRDLQLFDAQLFQFCLSTIWVHLRQLRLDPTPFGQCLSHFSEQLVALRRDIHRALVEQIGGELAKNLSAVSDIPRQYRWTKRPMPVGFSAYLATAFGICERFSDKTTANLGWEEVEMRMVMTEVVAIAAGDFCERAEKVLDAVEQTGSSLLRFKQRKAAAAGEQTGGGTDAAANESDESKIRAQLSFDTNLVRQRAQAYGIAADGLARLERIEQRAAATANANE